MSAIVSYFAKLADRHAWLRTKEFILYVGMGVPILPGVIAALIAPDDVLTNYRALKVLTDAMSALVPAIDKYANASKFPEVTRLTLSLFWFMGTAQAIYLYLCIAVGQYRAREQGVQVTPPKTNLPFFLLFALAAIWLIDWFVFSGPSPENFRDSSYLQAMSQFRIGLAWYGVAFFAIGILILSSLIASAALGIYWRYQNGRN